MWADGSRPIAVKWSAGQGVLTPERLLFVGGDTLLASGALAYYWETAPPTAWKPAAWELKPDGPGGGSLG
jgi:hypothetical protein